MRTLLGLPKETVWHWYVVWQAQDSSMSENFEKVRNIWVSTIESHCTGRFIMFSMITNIYNKKTKRPTVMELFRAAGKLKKFFLTTRDVRRVHHGWHGTHRYDIKVVATHAPFNIVSMCAVSPLVHTSNISSCQKKLFQFSCGCEQFHHGRSFGFLVINICNHGEHYETPCTICATGMTSITIYTYCFSNHNILIHAKIFTCFTKPVFVIIVDHDISSVKKGA